jgi:hypothetical protein
MSAADNKLDKIDTALGDTLAPAIPGDFNATLESVIAERGGPAAFSPSQLAAARRLSRLLTDEGRVDAPGISVLLTMLPAKPTSAPWDLSSLDDVELEALGKILCKIEGRPFPGAAGSSAVTAISLHGSPEFAAAGCDCGPLDGRRATNPDDRDRCHPAGSPC